MSVSLHYAKYCKESYGFSSFIIHTFSFWESYSYIVITCYIDYVYTLKHIHLNNTYIFIYFAFFVILKW